MKGSHFGTVKRLSTYVANGIWKLGIGDQEAGDTACVQLVDQGIDLWIHDGLTDLNGVYNCTPFCVCVCECVCICVHACNSSTKALISGYMMGSPT